MSSDEDDSGGGGKCFFGTALPELKDDDPANLRKKPLAIEEQVWSSTQFDPFSLYGQSNIYSFVRRADTRDTLMKRSQFVRTPTVHKRPRF